MAKNTGRGKKIAGRNNVPDVVGQITSTAQSNLTSAGFPSTVTSENTTDSNLNDKIKSQSIAAGTVNPLGTNVSLVKYTFSFTPFGFAPFGFTPFAAFAFTPFGFTPVFNFAPPLCIEENTLIDTPNGKVAAKNINVGDEVYSYNIDEIPSSGSSGESYFDYMSFVSNSLTVREKTTTTVIDIVPSIKNTVVYFNDETDKLFSTTQPMFIKRLNFFEIIPCGSIEAGDSLIEINEDGTITETLINSVGFFNGEYNVYQFNCEPLDWFVAGNYLVHNKA